MKILLLICAITLCALGAHAQNREQKITVELKDASLTELVSAVEKASGFSFVYGEDIKLDSPVSIDPAPKTIGEILKQAFAGQPVSYQISGKHVLLHKKEPEPKPASRKYTISGYITDKQSSETLIGANAYENLRQQGTTTNPYGFYTMTIPAGKVRLSFSYLGYTPRLATFDLHADTVLNIRLASDNMLDEVVVVSDRVESGIMATHTGSMEIPIAQIRNTPVILGESDVMKTIQLVPGVQSGVEGSAGLFVRGGGPDQNLVLLDGVPIYNVDHLLGFFSIFTPEAVKKVTLFKSSFPARFGGRLSSVVDVRTNDGDMHNYHGSFSLGLLSSRFNFEGPIIKGRTSFNVSMRRTYLDLITKPFMSDEDKIGYYFYDINAKVNHKFSDKNRLFLSFYQGNDYMSYSTKFDYTSGYEQQEVNHVDEKTGVRWGNTVVAARLNNIINNKLFSNITVAYNQYRLNMNGKSSLEYKSTRDIYTTRYKSGISDWSAQVDFDYTPAPEHHIKFGANYLYHSFKPEVQSSKITNIIDQNRQDTIYQGLSNSQINAHEFALYAEDNFDLTSRLRTNIGLHLSGFSVQGKTYFSLQPRLSARYQLTADVVLKASYSKMNQYINLLTSAPISMPTDLWVPVTKKVKPMLAHQYALGTYYTGLRGWEFSVEGYYKDMRNILEYKDATRFLGSSSGWEDKVEMGKGRSFGIEFMAQRTIGKTTGWLSYTLAKSDRQFAKGGINNGERFPYKYDRRHAVNLALNHKFNDRVDIGATWTFASGGTTTVARETTAIIRPEGGKDYRYYDWIITGQHHGVSGQDYIEGRNNYRLPASHRLNIGINVHKKTKNGLRTWNFSIYNAYNAMNPTFVTRHVPYDYDNDEYMRPVLKKITILPFIPSVTYTYKF